MPLPGATVATSRRSGRRSSVGPLAASGTASTSSVDVMRFWGISTWIGNEFPVDGSRQKFGSMNRLDEVAAISDRAILAVVSPN